MLEFDTTEKNIFITDLPTESFSILEQVKENISYGKSQHFTKIKIQDSIKEGEIVKCKITEIHNDILNAHII